MGKYELVRQLATGGMAEVFLAKTGGALGFEKTMVVKRIRPHLLDDPQFLQMFLQEAKLAAQLNHPNIVQVFDFGEAEGSYFLAMEHIDGPNLRTLSTAAHAAGRPIDFALCAKILSYACEGLAYAHEYVNPETQQPLNIVHRDVSPDNVVLAKNGAVKVVDFGIAKAAEQLYQTQSGLRKGKLAYMSPEYLKGGTTPDRRADVFALGVVLYELIANKKPYDAESEITLMHAMIYEPMVPVRVRRPEVPKELEAIVDKALKRNRDERYASCREMQADLEKFVVSAGEPLSAIHLSRLIASLQPELDAAAPAKTPEKARSGKTPPGKKTPSGQKTPPKRASGEKAPPKKASGEKPRLVTPAKAMAASDESTLNMTAEEMAAQLEALEAQKEGKAAAGAAAAVDQTMRLTADQIPVRKRPSAPRPQQAEKEQEPDEKTRTERPAVRASGPKPVPAAAAAAETLPEVPVVQTPAKAVPAARAVQKQPMPDLRRYVEVLRPHARTIAIAAAVLLMMVAVAFVVRGRTSAPAVAPPPPPSPHVDVPPPPPPVDQHVVKHDDTPPPPPKKIVEAPKITGTLQIASGNVAGAWVKIKGKKRGTLPFTGAFSPGTFGVEIIDPTTGNWIQHFDVEIKADETTRRPITVGKGEVLFNSIPDADVFVDKDTKPRGKTPLKLELQEGQHQVKFVVPQKQPNVQEFVVEPGPKPQRVIAKFQ